MSAKRPAPKPAKAKKAATRPAARKPAASKPAERAKAAAHVRKTVTPPKKAPVHRSPAAATPASTARKPSEAARKPVETASALEEPTQPSPTKRAASSNKPSAPAKTAAPARSPAPPAIAAEADENDSAEPGSLLAGPRNVQPYIAKRGEQYMGKAQLEHFREILNRWKQDLMREVDRTVTHMKDEAANFPDPNDRATQEEEFSLELRTRDRERKLIRKIDEAIKRIEDGSYGYCLETGEEIGIKRLEARPVATLSIEAQERRERRERQYGDRDDRYR
jgi:DnaK suppressor protein